MTQRVPLNPFKRKEQEKQRSEEERKKLLSLSSAYKSLFNTEMGRMVFRDLMEFCQAFETTMTGNSWTYFNEGKRAVGLHILYMREFGIEQELNMMRNETYKKSKEEKTV